MKTYKIAKKINLLVPALLSTTFLLAQQNQVHDIARIDFPEQTLKLSLEQAQSMAATRKLSSTVTMRVSTNCDYYLIDSLLLSLHGERWIVPYHYLENLQRDITGLSKVDGMNVDWIFRKKEINNYTVLIANLDSRDWGNYLFFSVDKRYNAILNGSLFYRAGEKPKASKVLNELLLGIAYVL